MTTLLSIIILDSNTCITGSPIRTVVVIGVFRSYTNFKLHFPPSQMNESTPAISQEEQIHLGAVTITIIATAGCFLLALALWTADYGNFNEFDQT